MLPWRNSTTKPAVVPPTPAPIPLMIPDSALLSHSLREVAFRSRYGLNVAGIRRNGEALPGVLIDEPLQLGDILLVIGDWKRIWQLQSRTRDFILLNLPAEVDQVAPAASQAPHALLALVLMVGMMPFALALEKTGGVDVVVRLSGGAGAHMMLLSLFILCAVTGLFISNTATAVLMAPIALGAARRTRWASRRIHSP